MKQSIQLAILSSANLGITFLFQWYVLVQLGPGMESDALFAGMTIPQLVLAVISGSLMHVLVPILAGENEDRLRHDAWALLVLIGALFGMLALALHVTASWWVPLTVPGFDEAAKHLTIELSRIQLIGMVFTAINGVQWAAYHARQRFIWAEFSPFVSSVITFALLIWALPRFGVMAAAWLLSLRMALQTLLLLPGMGRFVQPDLGNLTIRQAIMRIKPLLLGKAYYKTDFLVDRWLLSSANAGSLSLYYFSQQVYGAIIQIINKVVASPLVPHLSKLYKSGDGVGFYNVYKRTLLKVGGFVIIFIIGFYFFGKVVLDFLVGYGGLDVDRVDKLFVIMMCLSGFLVGSIISQIVTSAFYAVGITKTVMHIASVNYTIFIPIKIMAFFEWGVYGLALSSTAYQLCNMSLLIYFFKIRI